WHLVLRIPPQQPRHHRRFLRALLRHRLLRLRPAHLRLLTSRLRAKRKPSIRQRQAISTKITKTSARKLPPTCKSRRMKNYGSKGLGRRPQPRWAIPGRCWQGLALRSTSGARERVSAPALERLVTASS